ncbi:CHASE4 domain-containing protein [Vibrio aquaticus]|uniref:CHASE4 domain-containing protein n=1 Tax=Vibrio aquaticus TaxID=2496559 RepID=UPI001319FA7C|nr:CHASE4 domain-containing protein [Vibrio aquaticus]
MLGSTEKRLLVIFLAVTTFVLGAITVASYYLERHEHTARQFQENESKSVLGLRLLGYQLDQLSIIAHDYAFWDETYQYIEGRNEPFFVENFDVQLLDTLHIAGVAILNNANETIATSANISGFDDISFHEHLYDVKHDVDDIPYQGIMFHNESLFLFASAPIKSTNLNFPSNGRLLFFKQINQKTMSGISELIGDKFRIVTKTEETQFFTFIAQTRWQMFTEQQSLEQNTMQGTYVIAQDNRDRVPLEIQVHSAMEAPSWQEHILHSAAPMTAILITPILMIVLLRKYITRPLQELIRWLNQVDGSQLAEELKPFKHAGNGEVGELSEKFSSIYNNLYQQHQFSQLLLYSISDVIFTVDHLGNIDYCNPAATEWLNVSANQLYGQSFEFLISNMSQDTPSPANWLYRAIHSASEYSGISLIRKFGESSQEEWMEVQVSPMIKADDEPAGALIVLRSKSDYV